VAEARVERRPDLDESRSQQGDGKREIKEAAHGLEPS
jgi:hypothetical protein